METTGRDRSRCSKCHTQHERYMVHGDLLLCSLCSDCFVCGRKVCDTVSSERDGMMYDDKSVVHITCYSSVIGGLPLNCKSKIKNQMVFETPRVIGDRIGKHAKCEVKTLTDYEASSTIECTLTVSDKGRGTRRWICKANVYHKQNKLEIHRESRSSTIRCEQEGPTMSAACMHKLLTTVHKTIPDMFIYFYGEPYEC